MSRINSNLRTDYYFGLEFNGKSEIVIEKATEIPYKAKRYFTTDKDDKKEMEIEVYSKDGPYLESQRWKRSLKLNGISPMPKGSIFFEVCLWVDSSDQCYASMEEVTTGKKIAHTFKGGYGSIFNKGEIESISEDVVKPPEVFGTKERSNTKFELQEKLKLLKDLRENKGNVWMTEGPIKSECLDEVIKNAEDLANHRYATPEDKEKEMIKEVEKITALFYKSEFKLERDLGYKCGNGNHHLLIPKKSKLPCKVVHVDSTCYRNYEFLEGEQKEKDRKLLSESRLKLLGEFLREMNFLKFVWRFAHQVYFMPVWNIWAQEKHFIQ